MKTNFTRLLLLTALSFTVLRASSQAVGDYRTNFATAVAQWTTAASWQEWDGVAWVAAGAFPTSANGVITIQAGDSLQLSGAASNISIDQVIVEPGGILVLNANTSGAATVANGAGNDIIVNGRMYVAGNGNLVGTGTIQVNSGALFVLRSNGILGAPTTVDGTLYLGNAGVSAGTILSTTLTLNGNGVWIDGNTTLSTGGSFVNNGTFNITQASANLNWFVTGAGNSITNAGTMLNLTTFTLNIAPAFTNTGTIGGSGIYNFTSVPTNTGIISPGTSPGILTVSPVAFTGKTPTLRTEITGAGNVIGTDYDHLNIDGGGVNISGTSLDFSNTGTAPVGTTYNIVVSPGIITGTFASSNLTSNFTIQYNANSIVLTKIAMFPLPVTWGEFKALAQGSKVLLDWTTLMEENTSHFVIEHSTTGSTFTPVANVEARGNSTYEANYKYTFASPDLTKANYFRIKQVDLDGKSTYSVTRSVKFDKGQVVAIQAYPNPVKDVLTLNIQRENIQVLLADQTGKTIQRLNVQPGQHSINMQSLPTGIYQLAVFEKGVRIETKQIMKQ